jgi:tetratricopeptide (TPR) repeat protein
VAVDHRQLGVDLFNLVWTLLEKADRTQDDDELMAHAAHASAYHWRQVGEVKNFARSEWQCSRVYAELGRAEPALHHARRCLEWCGRGEVDDWDLPFAREALARAYAVAGDREEAERHLTLARELGDAIADAEDREQLESALATVSL